jgi:hypothetical protein
MGKILAGVGLLVLSFGIATAEEWTALISKVDGKKVTAKVVKFDKDAVKGKGGFGGGKGGFGGGKDMFKDAESKTFTVTADVKIVKGKFDKDTKKVETTAVEDGLKNKLFVDATEEMPVRGRITTNDKGEITEINLTGGFGGGKGGFGDKKKKDTSSN